MSTLREELADLQDTHQALSRSTNQTVSSQKTEILTLTHRNTLLEQQYEQAKSLAEERSEALTQLQATYDELSTAKESSEKRELEEESMSVVRDELHRQASYLRSLESSNSKMTAELKVLRERQTSVEVLREEKRGLERKIQMLEEFRTKAIKLEAEVEAGRKEREAWCSFLRISLFDCTHIYDTIGRRVLRIRSFQARQLLLPKPYLTSALPMHVCSRNTVPQSLFSANERPNLLNMSGVTPNLIRTSPRSNKTNVSSKTKSLGGMHVPSWQNVK